MAEDRLQLRAAVKALRKLGEHVEPWDRIDPREALLNVVHQAYTVKNALEFLVLDLEEDGLKGMGDMITVPTEDGPMTIPHRGGSVAALRIKMYNESLDRCAKLSKMAMDVGIEERMVKLAERQAIEIAEIIRASIQGLPMEQQLLVIENAAKELNFRSARRLPAAVTVEGTAANG